MRGQVASRVTRITDVTEIEKYKREIPHTYTAIQTPIIVQSSTCCFKRVEDLIVPIRMNPGKHWIEISDFLSDLRDSYIIPETGNLESPNCSVYIAQIENKGIKLKKINTHFYLCEIYHSDFVTDDRFNVYQQTYQDKELATFLLTSNLNNSQQIEKYMRYKFNPYYVRVIVDTTIKYTLDLTIEQFHETYCYFRGRTIEINMHLSSHYGMDYYYSSKIRDYLIELYPRDLGLIIDSYL